MISIEKCDFMDLPTIRSIALRTWPDTFKDILSPEQIEYMLNWMYSLESLKKQVVEMKHVFLMAMEDNVEIGFTGFELEYQQALKTKIHKIYILPQYQGKGVGKLLFDRVEQISRSKGMKTMSLNVNRENPAIGMYKKLGFEIVKQEDIPIGNGFYMNDYVMEKKIS